MNPFTRPIRPENVEELIDLTVEGDRQSRSMAVMQCEGIAAIYNILCERRFAYLADEVGMGKTYQALGLVALVWNEKPEARILFISPRQNLQVKWFDDYRRFFASNYRRQQRLGDDRVTSVLFGEPVHRPVLFDNLRSLAPTIGRAEHIAPFVRHTSFTRPVYLSAEKRRKLGDVDAVWTDTVQKLRGWGLFHARRPKRLSLDDASRQLNLAFASAFRAKLAEEANGRPYFDLVIVDEAHCLRNPDNQTNQVLFSSLRDQVDRWLFMSATPAHGGPDDLPTTLNHYPECGEVLPLTMVHDLPAMQAALQPLLVRRQRRYRTCSESRSVGKDEYRNHDPRTWGVRDRDMSVLGTLAMGLVQKGLVDVLQGRSNRYRIGFLSSFESLQRSIGGTAPSLTSDADASNEPLAGDWHREQSDGLTRSEAPDSNFIGRLSDDFEKNFGIALPHPKVESVVDRVAPLAFGDGIEEGGHKFLIFTRRVSTVDTLCDRLQRRYHQVIEARMRRCWDPAFDWSGAGVSSAEPADEMDDPEGFDHDAETSPFRQAMSRKGWLYLYRQTFRASGRNALFFEDGWLQRLCRAGGVAPAAVAQNIPDQLWAESWNHASHASGARRRQHRADRVRYLAVQAIRRMPQVFGLDPESAAPWQAAYEAALHEHLEEAKPAPTPHRAQELVTGSTLWTAWDTRFADSPLALPGAHPQRILSAEGAQVLHQRQVVRTLLGQIFRLTDTILDLYQADQQANHNAHGFIERFLDWLVSGDAGARLVRKDCARWLAHLRLIVDGCLEGAGRSWAELARKESWPQLFNPQAVIGVTGGSGAHLVATRQFRTPSLPRVIVCTDTLKEGVDLHLFCDRVLHYGVAWTSGDLEQRVGRVDRFFSLIERRLQAEGGPPEVALHVGYPHVVASLERSQVERVIERQRRAELLMDSPLAGARHEDKDLVVDSRAPRSAERELEPYRPHRFPATGRSLMVVSEAVARARVNHYGDWYARLVAALRERGWRISPEGSPVRLATLYGQTHQHDISWSFDAALGWYLLTLSNPPGYVEGTFRGGVRRRLVERKRREETFVRLRVPTPEDGQDDGAIARFVAALDVQRARIDADTSASWRGALVSLQHAQWTTDHDAHVVVARGERAHRVTLHISHGFVRIEGEIAALHELDDRSGWGGSPTIKNVTDWALETTNNLALGYLGVEREHLIFGMQLLHGAMSEAEKRRLTEEVAWRADMWEAVLTGADRR